MASSALFSSSTVNPHSSHHRQQIHRQAIALLPAPSPSHLSPSVDQVPAALMAVEASATGAYLSGHLILENKNVERNRLSRKRHQDGKYFGSRNLSSRNILNEGVRNIRSRDVSSTSVTFRSHKPAAPGDVPRLLSTTTACNSWQGDSHSRGSLAVAQEFGVGSSRLAVAQVYPPSPSISQWIPDDRIGLAMDFSSRRLASDCSRQGTSVASAPSAASAAASAAIAISFSLLTGISSPAPACAASLSVSPLQQQTHRAAVEVVDSRPLDSIESPAANPAGRRLPAEPQLLVAPPLAYQAGNMAVTATSVASVASVANPSVSHLAESPSLGTSEAVLQAAIRTAANLLAACGFLVWIQKSGSLPESTSAVLNQVAYQLLIPCFLMSHVAATVSASPFSPHLLLLTLPLIASSQLLAAAMLGRTALLAANHTSAALIPSSRPSTAFLQIAQSIAISLGIDRPPSASSSSIASPAAGTALDSSASECGRAREAVIAAACSAAGGDSLLVPLLFLMALMSQGEAEGVAGYLALFTVGWAPALWALGVDVVGSNQASEQTSSSSSSSSSQSPSATSRSPALNPPVLGVLAGLLVGATPLGHMLLPVSPSTAAASAAAADALLLSGTSPLLAFLMCLSNLLAGCMHPVMEAITYLGSAAVPAQLIVLATAVGAPTALSSIGQQWVANRQQDDQASNQASIVAHSIQSTDIAASPVPIPVDSSSSRNFSEASSLIATHTHTRPGRFTAHHQSASSNQLIQLSTSAAAVSAAAVPFPLSSHQLALPYHSPAGRIPSLLLPSDMRTVFAASAVRLLLLPASGSLGVLSLYHSDLLPQDPTWSLYLVVLAAIPSTEALVLLAQFNSGTRPLLSSLRSLLMTQWPIAVPAISTWFIVLASLLHTCLEC